jgi:FkbM family methyltransferase
MYPRLMANGFNVVQTAEPDPTNFFCLSYNCRQENIIKMQLAVGEEAGSVSIAHTSPNNCGMHKIHGEGAIPMLPLSAFNFPMLDLIQLDIEEYEINALRGAYGIIDQHRPVIILENATDQIKKLMSEFDYFIAEEITRLDTVFVPNKI